MFQFPPPKEPAHTDYLHISDCTTGRPIDMTLDSPSNSPKVAPTIIVSDVGNGTGGQPVKHQPPPRPPKSEAVARAHTNNLHRSSDGRGSTRSADRSPSFAATHSSPTATADDLYDFPRATRPATVQPLGGSLRYSKPNRSPHAISSLNAVPNAPNSAPAEVKHSYFNSATGFVAQGEEPYFINEERAHLPTVTDLCSLEMAPVRPPKRQQVQPPRPPKPANLQTRRKVASNTSLPNEPHEDNEIQYLDLDLAAGDSDSSSPRTPSHTQTTFGGMMGALDAHHRHSLKKLNGSPKAPKGHYQPGHYHQPSASMPVVLPSAGSISPSSAYKTIDFIKTKALAQTNETNKASKTQLGI